MPPVVPIILVFLASAIVVADAMSDEFFWIFTGLIFILIGLGVKLHRK